MNKQAVSTDIYEVQSEKEKDSPSPTIVLRDISMVSSPQAMKRE
jgi:hypothetical protein